MLALLSSFILVSHRGSTAISELEPFSNSAAASGETTKVSLCT
jgi:hypothetical protein